jgi:hypothetical protein
MQKEAAALDREIYFNVTGQNTKGNNADASRTVRKSLPIKSMLLIRYRVLKKYFGWR